MAGRNQLDQLAGDAHRSAVGAERFLDALLAGDVLLAVSDDGAGDGPGIVVLLTDSGERAWPIFSSVQSFRAWAHHDKRPLIVPAARAISEAVAQDVDALLLDPGGPNPVELTRKQLQAVTAGESPLSAGELFRKPVTTMMARDLLETALEPPTSLPKDFTVDLPDYVSCSIEAIIAVQTPGNSGDARLPVFGVLFVRDAAEGGTVTPVVEAIRGSLVSEDGFELVFLPRDSELLQRFREVGRVMPVRIATGGERA